MAIDLKQLIMHYKIVMKTYSNLLLRGGCELLQSVGHIGEGLLKGSNHVCLEQIMKSYVWQWLCETLLSVCLGELVKSIT